MSVDRRGGRLGETRRLERRLGDWARARLPRGLVDLGMFTLKMGWASLFGGLMLAVPADGAVRWGDEQRCAALLPAATMRGGGGGLRRRQAPRCRPSSDARGARALRSLRGKPTAPAARLAAEGPPERPGRHSLERPDPRRRLRLVLPWAPAP